LQVDDELPTALNTVPAIHKAVTIFQTASDTARKAEERRIAKRAKRKAAQNPDNAEAAAESEAADAALVAAIEAGEKKTTKKEKKALEAKFSEQMQRKSANEAARLATSTMFGRFGSKKNKSYSWMTGGAGTGASSPAVTPGKLPAASAGPSAAGTPSSARAPVVPKQKTFGDWDEEKDSGIQARDVLLVLETDGKAPRSYVRGYSVLDG